MQSFRLNGQQVDITGVPARTTLLDFLRARGLTGAKEGCAEGECGACAVLLVSPHGEASTYRAVNSCLLSAPLAAGREIVTVEGLTDRGTLAPAQAAMAAAGASQCGYCTPGFVISLVAEQYRPGRTTPCDPAALGGNLCRCTGYRPIRDAARTLGAPPAGPLLDRLRAPVPPLEAFTAEDCSRPRTLDAYFDLMRRVPGAVPIAGGTDLGVQANLRGRRWPHLVSLEALDDLRTFGVTESTVRIGAALTLTEVAERWSDAPPVFHEWLELFASPLVRNRATLGGNLATASPIGDAAPLLLALDAQIELVGPRGRRALPLAAFFTGYRRTALAPDELIAAVLVPTRWPDRVAFVKCSKRRLDDISTVAAGLAVDRDAHGMVTAARFAFGGVAATPIRASAAEQAIVGTRPDARILAQVEAALDTLQPIGDHRGSAAYRRGLVGSVLRRFLEEVAS